MERREEIGLLCEIEVVRDYYQEFAGDFTRVNSMRLMAAQFAKHLSSLIDGEPVTLPPPAVPAAMSPRKVLERDAMVLRHQGFTLREIASELDVALSTVGRWAKKRNI